MGNRTPFQTDKTELPSEILLRRECQRHQDTDLGYFDCQSVAYGKEVAPERQRELLGRGNYAEDKPDVLPRFL